SDGRGGTKTATVSVLVGTALVNAAPKAADMAVNATTGVPLSFDPRAYATDANGDVLALTAVSAPAYGTVSLSGNGTSLTYTSSAGYSGQDSFTYTIADGQ